MLKLNLLPPEEKKELELVNLSRLILSLAGWLSFFLIVFTLLLVSTFFCLSILLQAQDRLIEIRQSDSKMQNLLEIEEKIKQANQRINRVFLKQKESILWTPLLEEIAQIVPQGVYLTSFSYQATNNQINLNGWAQQRENLLLFQKTLEENPTFTDVKAPLANFIKQRDINFSFTFKPVLSP
jgi:type IV pilus assembly protein PilN